MAQSQAMTDLQAAVSAESTVVDSVIVLLNQLSAKIAETAGDTAAAQQLSQDVAAKAQALSEAVVANTPQV